MMEFESIKAVETLPERGLNWILYAKAETDGRSLWYYEDGSWKQLVVIPPETGLKVFYNTRSTRLNDIEGCSEEKFLAKYPDLVSGDELTLTAQRHLDPEGDMSFEYILKKGSTIIEAVDPVSNPTEFMTERGFNPDILQPYNTPIYIV